MHHIELTRDDYVRHSSKLFYDKKPYYCVLAEYVTYIYLLVNMPDIFEK